MRCFLVFFLFIFSFKAWSFDYQIASESLLNPSLTQRYELSRHFNKAGFTSLADRSLNRAGFPFDGAYISGAWQKSLLLKAGLKVSSSIEGQIIEEKSLGLLAFHFEFQGTPYLLLAINVSRAELAEIVQPWLKTQQSGLWQVFIPSAQAAEVCRPKSGALDGIQKTAGYIESSAVIQSIGRCGLEALQGASQTVSGTLDFFKKLATNPTALWGEMKSSFNELKAFALNLNSELQQVFQALGNLSPEQKAQIACTMTGGLLVGVAQGLLMPGSLAKLLPSLTLKVKKAAELLKQVARLEDMGFKMPGKSYLTREALSCVK